MATSPEEVDCHPFAWTAVHWPCEISRELWKKIPNPWWFLFQGESFCKLLCCGFSLAKKYWINKQIWLLFYSGITVNTKRQEDCAELNFLNDTISGGFLVFFFMYSKLACHLVLLGIFGNFVFSAKVSFISVNTLSRVKLRLAQVVEHQSHRI